MDKATIEALIADDDLGLLADDCTPKEREIADAFAAFIINNFDVERL